MTWQGRQEEEDPWAKPPGGDAWEKAAVAQFGGVGFGNVNRGLPGSLGGATGPQGSEKDLESLLASVTSQAGSSGAVMPPMPTRRPHVP